MISLDVSRFELAWASTHTDSLTVVFFLGFDFNLIHIFMYIYILVSYLYLMISKHWTWQVLNKVGPKSILGERSVLNSGSGEAAPCGATVTAASAVVVTISASRIQLLDLFTKDPVPGRD